MAQIQVNIINNSSVSPPAIDPLWVIQQVTPTLEGMSVPVRNEITIEFVDGISGGQTQVCQGHTYFGPMTPANIHDLNDQFNIGVIHEYNLARFTPCTLQGGLGDLEEGFSTAKTRWLFRKMSQTQQGITPQTSTEASYTLEAMPWLVGGGTYSFYTNANGGSAYSCVAGPLERIGALTGGDYRAIDKAIALVPTGVVDGIWDSVDRRDLVLSAIDSALSPMRIDGVLPSTFIRETRCSWRTVREKVFPDDVTYRTWDDGVNSTDFSSMVASHVGSTTTVTPVFKTGTLSYTLTDSTGNTVASEKVDGVIFNVRYPDSFQTASTGAYLRETCILATGGTCSSLRDKQFALRYRESDVLGPNQVVIITNGPDFTQFSRAKFDLSGTSVGKFRVRLYPGLFIIDGVTNNGNVEVTDGTRVRVFTSSTNAPVIETWTKFDDVVLMAVLDAQTSLPKSALVAGDLLVLTTVGATHNDPTINMTPSIKGCVGVHGTTRVAFTSESGQRNFGLIQSCSWGQIVVQVPSLLSSTVKVSVLLNEAESNSFQLNSTISSLGSLLPPRRKRGIVTSPSLREAPMRVTRLAPGDTRQ